MAEAFEYGEGQDTLTLRFQADNFPDEYLDVSRINVGVVENGEIVGAAAEYVPVAAAAGSEEFTTVTLRGDFAADVAFYVSFLNDNYIEGYGDRNVYLVDAEINGVDVEDASADLFQSGDYGPFYFDGDAAASQPEPEPEPEPEPVPGQEVRGTAGADLLVAGAGPDTLQGFGGDDTLGGGAGDDVLLAGAGADVLIAGAGDDVLTTNSGRDAVVFNPGDGADTVTDFTVLSDIVWLGDNEGGRFEEIERDGVAGTLVSYEGTGDELWLPGALGLGAVNVIA